MQARRIHSRLAIQVAVAGAAALVLCTHASPASAADDTYKGWFIALDAAMTQPNSLDQHFANENDPANNNVNQLVLDNDADFTWRANVGYSFGRGLGSLQVSYWTFDNEDKQEGTSGNALYPTIFGFGYNFGGMYLYYTPVTFRATGKVKARTVDLDYVRPIAVGEKFSVKWLAGFRVARYEEDRGFDGIDSTATEYIQTKHFESKANGLRIGVTGVFGFTKHFSLEASMASSFLQADTEGESRQTFGATGATETQRASDDHIRGEIRDYDLKAVWGDYGHLSYYVGYSASEWDGLAVDPVLGVHNAGFGLGPVGPRGRETIAFNSLHAGVVVKFGRAH